MNPHRMVAALSTGLAVAVLAAATAVAAPAPYSGPRGFDTIHAQVATGQAKAVRKDNAIRVTLKGGKPNALLSTIERGNVKGNRSVAAAKLRRNWNARFGFRPNVVLSGTGRPVTFHGVSGTPVWNAKKKTWSFQVIATGSNKNAAKRLAAQKGNLTARVLPQAARLPMPYKVRHPRENQVTNQGCSTSTPPAANSNFCVPYVNTLGTGGGSWVNVLSGTMQTTQTCQTPQSSTQIAGDTTTAGQIQIYETAAEAQAALAVSASVGYSSAAVSAEASAAFSQSSSNSTSSFYAIAQVNSSGGFVNFGNPTLTPTISSEAAGINSMDEALNFLSMCGDSVPVGYTVGSSWMSVLQITATSQSQAQSISASMSGSYMGASASASFSQALSSQSSSLTISESDYCWGPSSCFDIPGYAAAASPNMSAALTQFTNNYTSMLGGLQNACSPGPDYAACITQVDYAPIYTLLPSNFSSTSPAALVADAASAVYGVQSNLNSWTTGYQSLQTGYPTNSNVSSWNYDQTSLAGQAENCSKAYLGTNSACVSEFENCWDSLSYNASMSNSACLPSTFYTEPLYGLANPWTLAPAS